MTLLNTLPALHSDAARAADFTALQALVLATAWFAAGRLASGRGLAVRLAATGLVAFGMIVLIEAAIGFTGHMRTLPLNVATVFAAVAVITFLKIFSKNVPANPPVESTFVNPAPADSVVRAAALALIGGAAVCMLLWGVVTPPAAGGDGFIYHLFFPASWLHEGRIEYVQLPFGAQAATYYPLNTELLFAWLIQPLHEDVFTNAAQVFFLALSAAAVYLFAARAGAGRAGAALAAAAAFLIPAADYQATVARVDLAFTATFLLSVYFLSATTERSRRADFFLGVLALGLFLGTKTLAVVYSVVPLFLLALHLIRRRNLADLAVAVVGLFLFGGFWYARNFAATGNPLFPLTVKLFGRVVFPGAYGSAAMQAFHTNDPRELLRIGDFYLGIWFAAFLALCAVAAGLLGAAKKQKDSMLLFCVAFTTFFLFWFVNRHNNLTNGRFLLPAFFLAAACAGALHGMLPRPARFVLWFACAAALASGIAAHPFLPMMARDVATTLAGHGGALLAPARPALLWFLAALAFAVIAAQLFMKDQKISLYSSALLLALVALCSAVGLSRLLPEYRATKYAWYSSFEAGRAWGELDRRVGLNGVRIAHAGNERAYGLFGSGLRNDVFYADVCGKPDRGFHDYFRDTRRSNPNPPQDNERPQYHRDCASYPQWLRSLREGRAQLLFVSAMEPIALTHMRHDPAGFPIEADWAESHPETFRKLYETSGIRIYAVEIYSSIK